MRRMITGKQAEQIKTNKENIESLQENLQLNTGINKDKYLEASLTLTFIEDDGQGTTREAGTVDIPVKCYYFNYASNAIYIEGIDTEVDCAIQIDDQQSEKISVAFSDEFGGVYDIPCNLFLDAENVKFTAYEIVGGVVVNSAETHWNDAAECFWDFDFETLPQSIDKVRVHIPEGWYGNYQ